MTFEWPICGNARDDDDEHGPDSSGHQTCDQAEGIDANGHDLTSKGRR